MNYNDFDEATIADYWQEHKRTMRDSERLDLLILRLWNCKDPKFQQDVLRLLENPSVEDIEAFMTRIESKGNSKETLTKETI